MSGIFLDDGLNACGPNNQYVNYYRVIYSYIKTKYSGAFVVLNPGSGVAQCYASVADVLIVFESNVNAYETWQQPSWSQNQVNANQFWHLIYNVKTQQDMERILNLSKARNAGYVYVTDDDLPNPWDTLPQYWEAELNKI
ncbi:MAG: hypothetical protein GAK29_04658 [Acinetobacter bereziniae]|uniref:Uncharacterized protein n=1 Tax=Acinetobacter bereziniae TaxID=106648 RepID=A0A833PAQ4_ACIBZ|nr:MAG: hypothetical protein GAK29_04658 [Acinetobacter bereziniae]